MMDYRNAVFSSPEGDQIDCEVQHPQMGWIPFTARADDPAEAGRDLFNQIITANDVAAFPQPLPPSIADLHAHLSAIRRAHETGGVSVTIGPDVIEVATDQEGRTNLLGARMAAQDVPGFATVWSALNGRFPLDATGIIALSDAVLAHINGAFVAQDVVAEDIDAGTLTTPAEVEAAFAAAVAAV